MDNENTTASDVNHSLPAKALNPFLFRGKRIDELLQQIDRRFPIMYPTDEQVSDVDCLSFCVFDKQDGPDDKKRWVSLSQRLPHARLTIFLSMLSRGTGEKAAMEAVGMSSAEIAFCTSADKEGFRLLLAEAREWKMKAMRDNAVDALEQIVAGQLKPIIGRIGENQDGILTDSAGKELWERKYSDRAVIFALERLHKRFAPPEKTASGSAGQSGTTFVYNISVSSPAPAVRLPPSVPIQLDGGSAFAIQEPKAGESLAKMVGE